MNTLPAVYPMGERTEPTGVYRAYRNDTGQVETILASGPDGVRPEPDTQAEAARVFARADLRKAS